MMSTIALIDDHAVFRAGLRALLVNEADFKIVGEGADARGARAVADSAKPSVMVLDVTLPDGDGIATAQDVLRLSPHTRVLALTMHSGEFFVARAQAAGIAGYAIKTQPADEIVRAVRTVAQGGRYLPAEISDASVPRNPAGGRSETPFDVLSRREREVFDLIIRGYTNARMAQAFCISIKTVETHRSHINRKLGVHSTGAVVRLAALHGLLNAEHTRGPIATPPTVPFVDQAAMATSPGMA
jgi:two-component system response regulator NreC